MEIDISGVGDFTLILSEKNKKAIEDYIRNQEQEDMIADQISLKEYMDPFKGSK